MQLFETKAAPFVKPLILLLAYICLGLQLFYINNAVPLFMLGSIGFFTYFAEHGRKIPIYSMLIFTYFAYVAGMNLFIYTEYGGTVGYRWIIAFFSGAAIYHVVRDKRCFFLTFTTSAFILLVVVAFGMYLANPDILPSFYYVSKDKLDLFTFHPNSLGFMAGVAFIAGLTGLLFSMPQYKAMLSNCPGKFAHITATALDILGSKPVLAVGTVCSGIVLLLTYSRSNQIATIGTLFVILYFFLRKRFSAFKVVAAVLASGMLMLAALHMIPSSAGFSDSRLSRYTISVLKDPFNDPTFQSRLPLWQIAWDVGWESPLTGHGLRGYKRKLPEYINKNYDALVLRYGKGTIDGDTKKHNHAHNLYLHLFVEQGLIGVFFFLSIMLYPLWMSLRHNHSFGVIAPMLSFMLIFSLTDVNYYGRMGMFSAFAVFGCIGYFSCIKFDQTEGALPPQTPPAGA